MVRAAVCHGVLGLDAAVAMICWMACTEESRVCPRLHAPAPLLESRESPCKRAVLTTVFE